MAGVDAGWDRFVSTRGSGVAVCAGINPQQGMSVPPTRNGPSLFCPRVRGLTTVCIIIILVCCVRVFQERDTSFLYFKASICLGLESSRHSATSLSQSWRNSNPEKFYLRLVFGKSNNRTWYSLLATSMALSGRK